MEANMKRIKYFVIFFIFSGFSLPSVCLSQVSGWPREIKHSGNSLLLYQPQVDNWKNEEVISFRMAVMLTPAGESKPLAGALWLKADTDVNLQKREVFFHNIKVMKVRFSVVDESLEKKAEKTTMAMLPRAPVTVSLDRVLAGIKAGQKAQKPLPLQNDPPRIFTSYSPARLVIFDGEPVFVPIKGTQLQYVVNTNWDLFSDLSSNSYYLLAKDMWLRATDLKGPWTKATSLPADFMKIPRSENWEDVHANVPPRRISGPAPHIYISTRPAELIVLDGKMRLVRIKGTSISYIKNTESDLFYCNADHNFYYLVAGRWYRSYSLEGPWIFATPDLPPDFAKFPPYSKKARVLASVPGTPEAQEAVTVASIPQTATVYKKEASLKVIYVGEPKFMAIEGTSLFYAVNTETTVIMVREDRYYACERAVWFVSPSPNGPWVVANSVPHVIYTIPPSSPVYNVTYVVIKESTPDYIVVSYTPGYIGCYVSGGVVFWGTGYYYPAYWYPAPVPYYHPYPYTWGCCAWYNPVTNTYYRGGAFYGPYGGFGACAVYNPATGRYARGFAAYGPNGGYKVGSAYNPRTGAWAHGAAAYGPNGAWRAGRGYNPQTGTFAAGAQGTNIYGSWGRGVVSRGDQWVKGGYRTTAKGSAAGFRTSGGSGALNYKTDEHRGGAVKTKNDTYVGKDGNIYKKTDNGWKKWADGDWTQPNKPTNAPSATMSQKRSSMTNEQESPPPSTERRQSLGENTRQSRMNKGAFSSQSSNRSTFDGLNRDADIRQIGKERTDSWQRSNGRFGGERRSRRLRR